MKFYVYIHTTPDGKKYVGMTYQSPKIRWGNGDGYKSNDAFYRAIIQYGWDNIDHEIFFETEEYEMAKACEKIMISKYDTTNPSKGYNHSPGYDFRPVMDFDIIQVMAMIMKLENRIISLENTVLNRESWKK